MTTASEIFVCTNQPNGISTMDASPNILCYNNQVWYSMLPVSIIVLVGFNAIWLLFFGYMFLIRKRLKEKGTVYKHRFKFILRRFNSKFFFWEAVITLRKTFISILSIFFAPMSVIAFAIGILYVALVAHMNAVPFKRKFHNVCCCEWECWMCETNLMNFSFRWWNILCSCHCSSYSVVWCLPFQLISFHLMDSARQLMWLHCLLPSQVLCLSLAWVCYLWYSICLL